MDKMDALNIIRNIVKEIAKECKKEKVDFDANFCTFYVNLLALDPKWCLYDDILRSRQYVQQLISLVVDKLKTPKDPQILMLKTQFYFEYEFEHLEEMPAKHRLQMRSKLNPLRLALLEPASTTNFQTDKVYERVINYATILYGLGNPAVKEVYKEAETALKSFWGPEEMSGFMTNHYTTRSDLLEKVAKITTGIRLYNMDCSRGGYGIYNLPDQIGCAVEAVKEHISIIQEETSQKESWLTEVVHKCYKLNNQKYILSMQVAIAPYGQESDLEYLKDLLVLYKQHSEVLQKLEAHLESLETDIHQLKETYLATLQYLHSRVVPNMHIRAAIVFPVFEKLADLWFQFQDQTVNLKGLADIMNKQDRIVKSLDFESPLLNHWLEPYSMPSDIYSRDFRLSISPEVNVIRKENLDYFSKVKFELGGHCCWYLVLTQGALAMGDASNGVVKFKGCFYIFSSPLGTKSFARRPDYYFMKLLDLARRKCELINYLGIKQQLIEYRDLKEILEVEQEGIETANVETCTDDCMIPGKYIDPQYQWNVWELKREALRLADCINKATKACQTYKSSNDTTETQSWPQKDNSVQTHSDNYSNTTRPLQFIYGLRGRKDARQLQLDLTGGEIQSRHDNKKIQ